MGPTIGRRISDTERIRGARNPGGRRMLAVVLATLSLCASLWVLTRDIDWENRRREARRLGLSAEANGNYVLARRHYETALANHPYDWETHLSLATILNYRLNDYDNALRHYLYTLGYSPEPSAIQAARAEADLLRMVRRGELENPLHALEDMFLAVEAEAEEAFYLRLSPRLQDGLSAYWEGWQRRGRGEMVYCRIRNENDGFFDASVELVFADETSMSLHLYCAKNHVWRLEVGFP